MHHPELSIEAICEPSENLRKQTAKLSGHLGSPVDPYDMMRDYYALGGSPEAGHTFVVGDMANNLTGTTYAHEERARQVGLPFDHRFNGGHLASMELQDTLAHQRATGPELVEAANNVLRRLYVRLGVIPTTEAVADIAPAELFTGYFSHALITPKATTITSVGDVLAWVNGQQVAGQDEKPIDAVKAELVDKLTEQFAGSERWDDVARTLREFANRVGLGEAVLGQLEAQLFGATATTSQPDRQTAYRPVDDVVTPWQINHLQNPEGEEEGPLLYGAIDGRHTPERFVETVSIQSKDIETLVIATDGLRPAPGQEVYSTEDLVPTSPIYGEQTAIAIRGLTRTAIL